MEIRHLQYFKQVCADRNLSKAAKNLFITQQGLSHAIQTLERELGVSLFLRNKNGVTPTKSAIYLLSEAEEVLTLFDALKEKMLAMSKAANGTVTLSLTIGAMSYFVPKLVGEFHERHPQIELHLIENPDMLCDESVVNGKADIACTTGPVNEDTIEWLPLFFDSVMIMLRKDNPLAARDTLGFEDLKAEEFILPPAEFKWHNIIIDRCRDAGFEPNISYSIGDLHAMSRIIAENGGVGFVHKNLAETFRGREIALTPLIPDEKLYWHLGLAKKKGVKLSNAAHLVAGYISEISAERAALPEATDDSDQNKAGNLSKA
ncbi:MAG: LysR family transcriptional regulator [Clostridiales Family XIII bacterium]|jgi:DNA-binding transcriptional LysR family regulator|nr:LysR family transcriptional regulator [Clostridiales Family XIII bacterium]